LHQVLYGWFFKVIGSKKNEEKNEMVDLRIFVNGGAGYNGSILLPEFIFIEKLICVVIAANERQK
jgi:hypothetical protein